MFAAEMKDARKLWRETCAGPLAELFDEKMLRGMMRAPHAASGITDG